MFTFSAFSNIVVVETPVSSGSSELSEEIMPTAQAYLDLGDPDALQQLVSEAKGFVWQPRL